MNLQVIYRCVTLNSYTTYFGVLRYVPNIVVTKRDWQSFKEVTKFRS